ncbi:Ig-like domain-containing protein [Streptomyces sp. NA02950]|uniref:L,D-transpeptidase n=1 Tax=Streptomyces sp. NA02950 TaxID=2742137 RepID=UPI0020CB0397|nr:Ig-like domain-containing protein [Streptomyces sp. NA02950]
MTVRPISGAGTARGRGGLLALVLGALLVLVTACGGGGGSGDGDKDKDGKGGGSKPSRAQVTIAPKDGAKDVDTHGELKVTAARGTLTSVTVKDTDGKRVKGEITKDGKSWRPEAHLGADTRYTVDAVAKDSDGRAATRHAKFTTLRPKETFVGIYTPEDGSKVGVGMPVSLRFNRGITDPAAVEKGVEVSASPSVPVEGHWFGNDRLDFRPEKYWKPGTKVTLRLNLDGVEGRPGVYGEQKKTVTFTIGRSQVSVVDAKSKKMKVKRDGKTIKTIPITSGGPGNETYNGKMVISEKLKVTRMDGATVGYDGEYDIKDVPHAMRLSTSGTFIHGNYWAGRPTFGSANVSHGCVGLFDQRGGGDRSTPAAWFFRESLLGDVVVVKNSHDTTVQPDNGLNGWNMSWEKWKK